MKQEAKQTQVKEVVVGPVDRLLNVSMKVGEAAALMKKTFGELSAEIDSIAEEVEKTLQNGSEEAQKLNQLKILLKNL